MAKLSKISPCIWFDGQAEDAAAFYTKVFDNARIVRTVDYTSSGPGADGSVLLVDFEIEGIQFTALNGGPEFTPDEAISFQILCEDQAEIDRFW
ncbi:MAG: VOC family protein, partial [Acidimicrobiales bacterium]